MASVSETFSTVSLFLEQHRAALDLDCIDADILGAGRAARFAGRDVNLPRVQWAFDFLAVDEAVGEARLSVGAGVVRREDFSADVVEAHGLRAEMDEQGPVFRHLGGIGDLDPVLAHVRGAESGCSERGGCRIYRAFPL